MKQIGPNVYGNANNAMHDCCFYFTRGNDLFTPNYNFFTEAYIFFGHTTYLRLRFSFLSTPHQIIMWRKSISHRMLNCFFRCKI